MEKELLPITNQTQTKRNFSAINSRSLQKIKTLAPEIQQLICFFINPQWWSVDKSFYYPIPVLVLNFNKSDTQLIAACSSHTRTLDIEKNEVISSFNHNKPIQLMRPTVQYYNHSGTHYAEVFKREKRCHGYRSNAGFSTHISNTQTNEESVWFKHNEPVSALCFNHANTRLAVACDDGYVYIFDMIKKEKIASLKHPNYINAICFSHSDELLATTCNDGNTRIFKENNDYIADILNKHTSYTCEQMWFKNLLLNWLLIKKPDRRITTMKMLICDIAAKNKILLKTLFDTFNTFSEDIQSFIWIRMRNNINRFSKTENISNGIIVTKYYS
jgi:WD40 repeat protein